MNGRVIGQYRVTGILGEGGMGIVYAAQHTLLHRPAAIKVLQPGLSDQKDIVRRLFNEARAATVIRHPSIVEVYDFGWTDDGAAFIVMEYLDGETLRARCKRSSPHWSTALVLARQIASALAAAHAKDIIHRDLKPDNIFLVPDPEIPGSERIKLLDFGIARITDPGQHKTRTGAVIGTPTYMAPEQCRGVAVDARADLYALGCILFELCTGRPPFVGEGEGDVLIAHVNTPPPLLASLASGIPNEVESLVQRLLEKAPSHRIKTADELIEIIDATRSALKRNARLGSLPDVVAPASCEEDDGDELDSSRGIDSLFPGGSARSLTLPERPRSRPTRRKVHETSSFVGAREGPSLRAPAAPTSLDVDTTLSNAAGAHPPTEQHQGSARRLVPALVMAGGFAIIGVLGLVLVLFQGGDERPREVVPARSTAEPGASTSTASLVIDAMAPGLPSVAPTAPPARRATEVTISIHSEPSGAMITKGDTVVGTTPIDVKVPVGDQDLEYEIRRPGYQTRTLVLKPTDPHLRLVRLVQSPRVQPSGPARHSSSPKEPRRPPAMPLPISPSPQPAPPPPQVESATSPAAPPPAPPPEPTPPLTTSPENRGINPF